jgi:hypothetical protein
MVLLHLKSDAGNTEKDGGYIQYESSLFFSNYNFVTSLKWLLH